MSNGKIIPVFNEQEHTEFLMNVQKSVLLSLEQRKLLTPSQRERCLVELEKRYIQSQKSNAEHNRLAFLHRTSAKIIIRTFDTGHPFTYN